MSKTNSRKPKSSARTKKSTPAKKSTPKKAKPSQVWGVSINSNHVTDPVKVFWDDLLECYCTDEATFEEPYGFTFTSHGNAYLFVDGARMARSHIVRMLGMDKEAYYEEGEGLKNLDGSPYTLDGK